MEDMSILEQKYGGAPICWAITDVIGEFIEDKKGRTFCVSMEEIREK